MNEQPPQIAGRKGPHSVKRCVLHIGPPKTGTTSIQAAFSRASEVLCSERTLYGSTQFDPNPNHRYIVSASMLAPEEFDYNRHHGRDRLASKQYAETALASLEGHIAKAEPELLVLSSEHATLLARPEAEALAAYLKSFADQVEVHFYARAPNTHSVSLLQEAVKNGARRLTDVLENPPIVPYRKFGWMWSDLVGKENVHIHRYPDGSEQAPDVVVDFAAKLGINPKHFEGQNSRRNKSLSGAALLIADALTEFAPKFSGQRSAQPYLSQIAGPKFVLPQAVVERVMQRAQIHLEYLKRSHGIEFDSLNSESRPFEQELFDEDALRSVAVLLNDLASNASQK